MPAMPNVHHHPAIMLLVAVFGLAVGSFLNVVIYRLPKKKSLLRPCSSCPSCGAPIPWYLNIPVLSYVVLRGKCHRCGAGISVRYPLVEAATAVLFLLFFLRYGLTVTTVGFWFLSAALVAVFFIDLEHGLIPDLITLPGTAAGLALAAISPHLSVPDSILGALVGGGSFLALAWLGQALFKKDSMGGGDIKLAAMLGAFLGPLRVLLIFVCSAAVGLLVSSAVLLLSPRFRRERVLPFGPFLVAATLLVAFFGQTIIDWYRSRFLVP